MYDINVQVETTNNARGKMRRKGREQSSASRLDESLGMRRGKESSKKQSYSSRRDESKGMSYERPAETHLENWSNFRNRDPNAQTESGSMDYLRRSDAIQDEDDRTIARFHKDIKSARS